MKTLPLDGQHVIDGSQPNGAPASRASEPASPHAPPGTVNYLSTRWLNAEESQRVRPAAPRPTAGRNWMLLAAGVVFIMSFFLNAYRTREAVDLRTHEASHAIRSVSLAHTGVTRWNGAPLLADAPLAFALEGLYFKLLGIGESQLFERLVEEPYQMEQALLPPDAPLTGDNVLNAAFAGRYLSILYGALLAALLFVFGTALLNRYCGLIAGLLTMLDPYVVRHNHLNVSEPLAALMGLFAIFFYFRATMRSDFWARQRNFLAMGVFLGLALLSQELVLLYLPAFLLHATIFRRNADGRGSNASLRELIMPVLVGVGIYGIFPLSAALAGHLQEWWGARAGFLAGVSGVAQGRAISGPAAPVVQVVSSNLQEYWPSWVTLGVAGLLAACFLYLYLRRGLRDAPAELLTALVIGCGASLAAVWLAGGEALTQRALYLAMPVGVLMVAYAATALPRCRALRAGQPRHVAERATRVLRDESGQRLLDYRTRLLEDSRASTGPKRLSSRIRGMLVHALAAVALVNLLGYNLVDWAVRYGLSRDDSYAQIEAKLAETLPPGEQIVGRDLMDLFLLPRNPVYLASGFAGAPSKLVPMDIAARGIRYAILNRQSLAEGSGEANAEFYDWVQKNSTQLMLFEGQQFGTAVYQISYTSSSMDIPVAVGSIAQGKEVFASSVRDVNDARHAFDGQAYTRWASDGSGREWIFVDLGRSETISRVELTWERAFAFDYSLQVSDDGQGWTTFFETRHGSGAYETVEASAKGRYVRLLMTRPAVPEEGYSLWEIGVYR